MASSVVRVDQRIHSKLRKISENKHRPVGQIVADLVDRYDRDLFWRQMHEGFAELRDDPEAWRAYQDEVALWDSTLSDGLEQEEPYYTKEEEEEINARYAKSQGGG